MQLKQSLLLLLYQRLHQPVNKLISNTAFLRCFFFCGPNATLLNAALAAEIRPLSVACSRLSLEHGHSLKTTKITV